MTHHGRQAVVSERTPKSASFLSRILGHIVGGAAKRPRVVIWPILLLACAAVGVTVSHLRLRTSRSDLIDPAAAFSQSWTEYKETFGTDGDLIVVVKVATPAPALIATVLDSIGEQLRREPELFRNVLYRIDQRQLRRKGLQFLSEDELQQAIRRVESFSPILRDEKWDLVRTDTLTKRLRTRLAGAQRNRTSQAGLLRQADRFVTSLDRFLDGSLNNFRYNSATFQSPWQQIVSTEVEPSAQDADIAYLMNRYHTLGMLQVIPIPREQDFDPNAAGIRRLREICDEVSASFGDSADFTIAVTGIPVLEHDELSRARMDMLLATAIALVAVGTLLSLGFRSVRHPMLILLTLVIALSCTFGVATLAVGHLNILSICFTAILIGLGVDFGIHFLSRYQHQRQKLHDVPEALKKTGLTAGSGILTSAVTTALAFGSAALTGFPGVAELGIVAGSGILICAFCTFVFLPALISLSDTGTTATKFPPRLTGRVFRRVIAGLPLAVITLSVLGVAGLGSQAFDWSNGRPQLQLNFDDNLMHLQDPSLESVRAQHHLEQLAGESLLYAVAVADTQSEAIQLRNRFQSLPSVSHVSELASRLPPPAPESVKRNIRALKSRLDSLTSSVPQFKPANPRVVGRELDRLYEVLLMSGHPLAQPAAKTLNEFLDRLAELKPDKQAAILDAYQNLLAGSLVYGFERVALATNLDPVVTPDIPQEWRHRFFRKTDTREQWLLKIYPTGNVWDEAELTAFVQDLRTISPDVTGIPVQNYESSRQLRQSYRTIGLYSLAVISLFLLFDFLRPGQKLLTLVAPMLVTGFIGYTMHRRSGELNLHLLVPIYLGMVAFIALVVDFRNLRDTVLALLPPLVGAILMAGSLALLQVSLNPLNLIVLPLVLGIGVDDGIHIVHDYRRQIARGIREYAPSGDTLLGVILTSLTSIVGFGSLLIAGHRGLVSVGIVMAIGVGSCLLVALILLPAILTLVARHQPPSLAPVATQKPTTKPVRAHVPDDDDEETGSARTYTEPQRPLTRRERRRQAGAA